MASSPGKTESKTERPLRAGELQRWKAVDFYEVLSVPRTATQEELKKAYRKEALRWHPDRHAQKSEKERLHAEERFKLVSEANAIFQDHVRKNIYDRDGFDGLTRIDTAKRSNESTFSRQPDDHACNLFEHYTADQNTQQSFDKTVNEDLFCKYSTDDMDTQRAYYKAKSKSAWDIRPSTSRSAAGAAPDKTSKNWFSWRFLWAQKKPPPPEPQQRRAPPSVQPQAPQQAPQTFDPSPQAFDPFSYADLLDPFSCGDGSQYGNLQDPFPGDGSHVWHHVAPTASTLAAPTAGAWTPQAAASSLERPSAPPPVSAVRAAGVSGQDEFRHAPSRIGRRDPISGAPWGKGAETMGYAPHVYPSYVEETTRSGTSVEFLSANKGLHGPGRSQDRRI